MRPNLRRGGKAQSVNVTAMLAWYDEPPEMLYDAVTSVACVADSVIAVDGGYELRPDARPRSPAFQEQAIQEAADDCDLELMSHHPRRVWRGQVEKRDWMLRKAAFGADWVMPLDADWVVKGERLHVRQWLEMAKGESLAVTFYTPRGEDAPVSLEDAPHPWHQITANNTQVLPLIYRVMADMRVEKNHWWYSGVRPSGERVSYWGYEGKLPNAMVQTVPHSVLTIDHMCFYRDHERTEANRAFCAARDEQKKLTGVEA